MQLAVDRMALTSSGQVLPHAGAALPRWHHAQGHYVQSILQAIEPGYSYADGTDP